MIDAHHHFWRQADLPWLLGPEVPRIFGPYAGLKRDYPLSEYLADVKSSGIKGSVYIQVNWAPNWALDEVRWVADEAAKANWPISIVGYADMTRRDAEKQIKALAGINGVVGIRHQLHWHQVPEYRFAPHADLCEDETVQANIALLGEYGLSFDLQVFSGQMAGAVKLVKACPQMTFILNHAGMLEDTSKAGRAHWQAGLQALAKCPNVICKLSGLGTFTRKLDAKLIGQITTHALDLFGAERCLYGSNFPIEKLWTSYPELFGAQQNAVPEKHHTSVFHETAARIYRLNL